MILRKKKDEDFSLIQQLLKENQLPYNDIKKDCYFLVIEEGENEIIGCIGLEIYGEYALLRSLAVNATYKGKGLGKELVNSILSYAKSQNVTSVHLLTTTASEYFNRFNFTTKTRSLSPSIIQNSSEFSEICPSHAIYMTLTLNQNESY